MLLSSSKNARRAKRFHLSAQKKAAARTLKTHPGDGVFLSQETRCYYNRPQ
jgi:hypothetical protein